jgi:hypothetical protein
MLRNAAAVLALVSTAAGLGLVGAASAQTGGLIRLACTQSGEASPSMALIIDLKGGRAKGHILTFSDDQVPFMPAQITEDAVTWRQEAPNSRSLWVLDRNTGTLRLTTAGNVAAITSSYVCKAATRLF